jgi:hypothetical protein
MKRTWWGVSVIFFLTIFPLSVFAVPTTPFKTTGPFVISAYSFTGPHLRYVQIFNTSNTVASLDGWKIVTTAKSTPANVTYQHDALSGVMAPKTHVIASQVGIFINQSFTIQSTGIQTAPTLSTLSLVPPEGSGFLDETVTTPSITSSTPREGTNYYVKRSPSETTGNTYLSSFTFGASPGEMMIDQLYVTPNAPGLKIYEVFSDSVACGPFDVAANCADYVKVYNPLGGDRIDLSKYRVRTGTLGQSSSSSNTTVMSGYLEPGRYASYPINLSSSGGWIWIEDLYGTSAYQETTLNYPSNTGYDEQAWSYDDMKSIWQWTPYLTPSDQNNRFLAERPINECEGVVISELAANVDSDDQFIELFNPSQALIDLSGCVIQTNRSSVKSHVFTDTTIPPLDYLTVYIKDTDLTLTKTTTGTVYLLSSDQTIEVDTVSYADLKTDTSWMRSNDVWQQTYTPTPGEHNVFTKYSECDPGYFRSLATGYCNKNSEPSNVLAACAPGKYRNPATNRCRKTAQVSSAVADFPVESITQTGQAALGWWAFGGVGLLAAGYAGWEWRFELMSALRKMTAFVSSGR